MKHTPSLLITLSVRRLLICALVVLPRWVSKTLLSDMVGWLTQRSKYRPDHFLSDLKISHDLPFAAESSSRIHDTIERHRRKFYGISILERYSWS